MLAPKAIDLFCGCGGISAGLRDAGFDVIAGCDTNDKYMSTFTHNFPSAVSYRGDLSKTNPVDFIQDLGIRRGELDLLAGGPPCQGFSKNVPRRQRTLDAPTNVLVRTFMDFCERILPKSFLMENVAEMKNSFDQTYTDEIMERLTKAGYSVVYGVLNAADYGVPQRRRRAFFIGHRNGMKPGLPAPSHDKKPSTPFFSGKPHVSVWDAIGDLDSLRHGEGQDITPYGRPAFSEYQRKMRNPDGMVRNHIAKKLAPTQYARISALLPGQGVKDLPEHLQTKGGYSGAYGRLTEDMIAPTITRWVFHPGSGRWGHPRDLRLLTMRETARIQGFCDSYVFTGTYNDQAGQLGNAVPMLLASIIAQKILRDFNMPVSSGLVDPVEQLAEAV